MNALEEAFDSLLDAQEEARGYREQVTLNGHDVDFLVGDTNLVDLPVEGGLAESGSYVGLVRLADWTESRAEKFSPFVLQDHHLQVMGFQQINCTMQVTAGDPTATEQ